jgi:GT2 family glycosyltransferase
MKTKATPIETSIIIVNWNSRDHLKACLATLRADLDDPSFEATVVDSGSFDGAEEMIRERFPAVRFVQSRSNIGFGRANNLGASRARGDTLIFLNPDTLLPDGALHRLRDALTRLPNAGLVGCRLTNTDGSLQLACVQAFPSVLNQCLNARVLLRLFPKAPVWTSALTFEHRDAPVPVDAVIGACMVTRKDLFCEVGGFSADYFMYVEDIDLCHKIRSAGRDVYYIPEVVITHHGGGTTNSDSTFSSVMTSESLTRFFAKTRGDGYALVYRSTSLVGALLRLSVLLTLAAPARIARRSTDWRRSFRKWTAILRWAVGKETSTRQYDGLSPVDPRAGLNIVPPPREAA